MYLEKKKVKKVRNTPAKRTFCNENSNLKWAAGLLTEHHGTKKKSHFSVKVELILNPIFFFSHKKRSFWNSLLFHIPLLSAVAWYLAEGITSGAEEPFLCPLNLIQIWQTYKVKTCYFPKRKRHIEIMKTVCR